VNELPIPKRSPATGKSAMGSIKERPTLCRTPKILSFIFKIPPKNSMDSILQKMKNMLKTKNKKTLSKMRGFFKS
jgi:hypothetical protein